MKAAEPATEKDARWSKTQYANLIRYVPSGIYFTRIRVRGKLIIKTLKTASVTVAKLRMADLEKDERKKAENQTSVTSGKMTFSDVLALYRQRLQTDVNLKPRSKEYREERISALLKSWPDLKDKDVRQVTTPRPRMVYCGTGASSSCPENQNVRKSNTRHRTIPRKCR